VTVRLRLAALALLAGGLTACGSSTTGIAEPGAVDVGFAQDMAVHHEQAIQMSQLALRFGTPAIREVAMGIMASQSQELGAMRGWLRVWGKPVINPSPMAWMGAFSMPSMPGMDMSDHMAMGGSAMPGMATPDQLIELTNARGKAFDILFAKLMVTHHVGGIQMDQAAIDGHASSLVTEVAKQELADQYRDLGLLRTLLAQAGIKS
jgi:uncharacterized protein (DUF305 family)